MSGEPANSTFAQDSCRITCFPARKVVCWLVLVTLIMDVVGCAPSTEEPPTKPLAQQPYTLQSPLVENITSLPPTMTPVKEVTPLLTVSPEQTIDNTPPSTVRTNATPQLNQESEQFSIHLQWGTIDTRRGEPQLPDPLRIDAYAPDEEGYYIVQFHDKILPEWTMELEQAGINIMGYVPNNAFVVQMTHIQCDMVTSLDKVQWVGIFQPAYKISPRLSDAPQGETTLIVLTFPGVDMEKMATNIQELGGLVESQSENEFRGKLKITIDLQNLISLARLNGVMWIEPWVEPTLNTSP